MTGPFRPFPAKPPARILLYGDPGTEKTRRALSQMPGPTALIDLEDGSSYYGDLAAPGSGRLLTRSIEEIRQAILFLDSKEGRQFQTVIVDPITVVWEQVQEGLRFKIAADKRQDPAAVLFDVGIWSRLNAVHASLLTGLVNLPQHLVCIARGKEKIDGKGQKLGYGPDCHKAVAYTLGTVIETRTGAPDTVIKDRSGAYAEGQQRGRVDLGLIVQRSGHTVTRQATEEESARRDAGGAPAVDPEVYALKVRLADISKADAERVKSAAAAMFPGKSARDLTAPELQALIAALSAPPPEPGSEG